jgi:biotin carboxyl carrier protein
MPGTFYRRPDPESDPYVEEGEQVSAGDTVGLIEVMKSFHEVKAEEEGTIARARLRNRPFSQAQGTSRCTIELAATG